MPLVVKGNVQLGFCEKIITLHASEAAVQCIVIGPVCLWVCVFVGLLP